jgi:ethanolamine ammonia-lyase small subunit
MSERNDLWDELKSHTPARLGLGRVGASLPTKPWLAFGLAHAAARDAVHILIDWDAVEKGLREEGVDEVVRVASAATDRGIYLRRPDLGRRLDDASRERLLAERGAMARSPAVVWILGDGLSSAALENHAAPLFGALRKINEDVVRGPVILANNARVALGDEIGAIYGAEFVVVAIGERPGLSSPDSLGLYLTRAPKLGRSDSERNCLSNVRTQGMPYSIAALKLCALIAGARVLGATGTRLKDETDSEGRLLSGAASRAPLPSA